MPGITPPFSPNDQSSPYQLTTDNCPICYSAFAGSKVRVIEACKHMFHDTCLMTWLSRNTTCPLCRTSLGAREVQPAPVIGDNPHENSPLNGERIDRALLLHIAALPSRRLPSREEIEEFFRMPR
ncbi:RING finger domain-containing protein [Endozoicomonas sp. ONNA2]|uniref:RING finger domain-containing protein n=1 Tax=Endozoicomonas sp. ONNA2 TaxID=2828741 RepID=UPI002148FDA8|nr:RING finger domain-containing protein [Endozoicomonas sp. ONNA2]